MSESSHNKQKGNPRKARTRRAHGGPPSANLSGRRKERAKETKGAKEKGRRSSNWAFKNPKSVPFCRDYFIKKTCQGQCGRSHNCPVVNFDGWVVQDPKSISQKIALTRLERIGRLPVALWRIPQRDSGAGGTCSVITTVGGRDTRDWGFPGYAKDCGSKCFPSCLGNGCQWRCDPKEDRSTCKAGETCRA